MNKTEQNEVMSFMRANIDDIPYKTLRMGEIELTDDEKLEQMSITLNSDPGLFLSRWGRYLSQNILSLFQLIEGDYEVNFYLSSLLYQETESPSLGSRNQKSALHTLFQNRRYEYLKRELRKTSYFTDEDIQLREPELYQQYVGQYVSEREKKKPFSDDVTLVNRILSNIDRNYVNDCINRQKTIDEEQFEEEEESDDEPIAMDKDVDMRSNQRDCEVKQKADEDDTDEDDIDDIATYKEEKRNELVRLLEEKFLSGKDATFDYDEVDYNEDYDDIDQQERDYQEQYFDEDD